MRPLDPLAEGSLIARLLKQAPPADVRAELARLAGSALDPAGAAALRFARGALSLREGALDAACTELDAAAEAFVAVGQAEAGSLARAESLLAAIRRGPRTVYASAMAALDALVVDATAQGHPRVVVVALHYRGTAERLSGDALATQRTLLDAFGRSEPFLEERAQILNSLGTLYVVLGAHGAARALLEHGAEIHHRVGDAIGEAIAHGQLGSAALALGDLEDARRHLQKQEWLASRVGDAFGRGRALIFLADVALDVGRPDEAAELAGLALVAARSVEPPLALWVAYATRALGRACMELGKRAEAEAHLASARAAFAQFGNPLGQALAEWDLAHLTASVGGGDAAEWFAPAWVLGSLGLPARLTRLLADRAALDADPAHDALQAAVSHAAIAQAAPHLASEQEVSLVYGAPEALSAIAARRTSALRNLGRLAALSIAPPGLFIAAVAAAAIGEKRALPPERAAAAALFELPGAVVWSWPSSASADDVGRDLAALRAALGEDARAVLVACPQARVIAPPFHGEVSAEVFGIDAEALIAQARALPPGALHRAGDVPWSTDADARVTSAGFLTQEA